MVQNHFLVKFQKKWRKIKWNENSRKVIQKAGGSSEGSTLFQDYGK